MTNPEQKQRRLLVLGMLADAGARGRTDPEFVARFTPELLDLVSGGLATASREVMITCGRPSEVARVRITEEGWRVIEEDVSPSPQGRIGGRLTRTRTGLTGRQIGCSSRRNTPWRSWSRLVTTALPIGMASPFDSHQTSFCPKKQKTPLFVQ
jgi:hypothetical protein